MTNTDTPNGPEMAAEPEGVEEPASGTAQDGPIMTIEEAFDKGFADYSGEADEIVPLSDPLVDPDDEADWGVFAPLAEMVGPAEGEIIDPLADDEDLSDEGDGDTQADAKEKDAPADDLKPLSFWSDELAQQFAGMDDETKRFVLDIAKDSQAAFTRRTQQVSELAGEYDGYRRVALQWQDRLAEQGYSGDQAFGYLMHVDDRLQNGSPAEKLATLADIAREYDIPPVNLRVVPQLAATPDGGPSPALHPTIPAAQPFARQPDPAVAALQHQVSELTGYMRDQEIRRERILDGDIQAELDQFMGAMDRDSLLHPYADHPEVCERMAVALEAPGGEHRSLKDVYEEAIWTVPSVREVLIAGRKRKDSKERDSRVERAKKASALNTNAPSRETRKSYDHIKDPRKRLEAIVKDVFQ